MLFNIFLRKGNVYRCGRENVFIEKLIYVLYKSMNVFLILCDKRFWV